MDSFVEKYGPWALITGASAGLGDEFARQLAPRGMNLALVARRKDRLDSLADELSGKHGIETRVIRADLAAEDFMTVVGREIDDLEIGLLVNNAGFAVTGKFLDNPLERELELLHVNCRAPLILSHFFGRKMLLRKKGGIIILSSVAAFVSAPYWLGYSSSKAYNLVIGEALRRELRNTGVDVQALCPGSTRTEFGSVAGVRSRAGSMKPETVVAESLRKLGKKPVVLPGMLSKISYVMLRFFPRRAATVIMGIALKRMKSA